MRKVLVIFIDGFGLGENNKDTNPLVKFDMKIIKRLFGYPLTVEAKAVLTHKACFIPTDATLGVAGLPQSATGQTAIFTGVNAPLVMGRHIQGFPGPSLAAIIAEQSILLELVSRGLTATSANAYTPNYMEMVAARKRKHSVTTLTLLSAGIGLRSLAELEAGQAINQDITNKMLPQLGIFDVEPVSPQVAGMRLANIAQNNHFTMFEYFQTDRFGHKRDWGVAEEITNILDEFITAVYQATKEKCLVIITSDHGNFEDFSVKTHTYNLVPTILWGPGCYEVAGKIKDITDIKPAIMEYLGEESTG
ncbi:MAG: hypothetical protein H6Q67_1057 [Firmicutes bacterium]|nr:hypothetical protein [Bacillota bacterium]